MIAKRRGPGAGNAGASKKNAPLKSESTNNRACRNAQQRNPRKPGENRAGAGARRSHVVYDGQQLLGRFIFNEATNQAVAWNAARQFLGRFGGFKAASRAISRAAVTEWRRAEARRRLDDPTPSFVSGLPEHFLRRG